VGGGVTLGRRGLIVGGIDVAQAGGAGLGTAYQWGGGQGIDDRPRIGKTTQNVAPPEGVLLDERGRLAPRNVQPTCGDVSRFGKRLKAVRSQQRGSQVCEKTQILAFGQRVERLVTNLDPFRRLDRLRNPFFVRLRRRVQRSRLAEQPERVERREQFRVLEAFP